VSHGPSRRADASSRQGAADGGRKDEHRRQAHSSKGACSRASQEPSTKLRRTTGFISGSRARSQRLRGHPSGQAISSTALCIP